MVQISKQDPLSCQNCWAYWRQTAFVNQPLRLFAKERVFMSTPTFHDLVSVIIPVYNGTPYLAAAVESVRQQSYEPLDIIVVDDGSTDGSYERVQTLGEVRCFRQANRGTAAARNVGIKEARGRFLAFLDADDIWTPGKLKAQLAAMQANPHAQLIAGRVEEFYDGPTASVPSRLEERRGDRAYTIGALVVRQADFLQVGFLNESLRFGEFMDWRSRTIAAGFQECILREVVLRRRLHDRNTTLREGLPKRLSRHHQSPHRTEALHGVPRNRNQGSSEQRKQHLMTQDEWIYATLLRLSDPMASLDVSCLGGIPSQTLWRMLAIARVHGVLGFVLDKVGGIAVRFPEVWKTAQRSWRGEFIKSLRMRRHAEVVLRTLADRGVPAFILKGSDFADQLYPNPVLRRARCGCADSAAIGGTMQ